MTLPVLPDGPAPKPFTIEEGFRRQRASILAAQQRGVLNTTFTDPYGAWQDFTLQSLWAARAGFYVPGYRLTPGNRVELTGTAIGGTTTSGTLLATLPVGFRPAAEVLVPLVLNNGYTAGADIKTDGTVSISAPAISSPSFPSWSAWTMTGSFPLSR